MDSTVRVMGEEIRRRRMKLKLTQAELATRAGVDKRSVHNAEKREGMRRITIEKLAGALQCRPEEIALGWSPDVTVFQRQDPRLEQDLCHQFALREALIIHGEEQRKAYDRDDTDVHEDLGRAASRLLGSLLRPKDVIGVGGGRAPRYCVHHLPAHDEMPECRAVSLCGRLSSRVPPSAEASPHDEYTDADGIADHLIVRLGGDDVTPVRSPLAVKRVRAHPHKRPDVRKVTVALLGLGVLSDSHPLARFQENPELFEISSHLEKLFGFIRQSASNLLVGDICNYLFRVAPATPSPDVDSLINRINSRTITLKVDSLAGIRARGAVLLVAGGSQKAPVIRHVLNHSPRWISHLVTDDSAATALCARDRDVDLAK